MRIRRASLGATALAALALLVAPALPGASGGRALAHAQLVASSPAAGSVLPASPSELRLVFSEPIEAELTSLDVVAQDGTVLIDHGGEPDPDDPYALVVADPSLPDGVFSLTWRTLSAADGHAAEGFFTFGIGDIEDSLPQVPGGGMTHAERDRVSVAGRWITYVGLLSALGLAVFHRFVLRTGSRTGALRRLIAGALVASALGTATMALLAAVETGDPGAYLTGRNGLLQLARIAVAGVGAAVVLLGPGRIAVPAAGLAGLVGIALLVTAGHAAALSDPVPILVGIVHVAAAGVWIGGILGLVLLGLRPEVVGDRPPSVRDALPRFSALALVAVGLIALTGVYSAWAQTGAVIALDTEYGRTLALKSIAATAAVAIGAFNYVDGGRGLAWLGGLAIRLRMEVAIAGVVLVFAALLATTPPVDAARGVPITPIPDAFGAVLPDVGMEIGPGRPGVNRITVTTTDALAAVGGLALSMDRVDSGESTTVPLILSADMGHAGMASASGTVEWYADALVLPPGSSWDTSVLVLSGSGTELARQRFAFALDAEGIADGRLSTPVNPGSFVAVLLIVGGALGVGLGLGGMPLPRCDRAASRVALLAGGTAGLVLGILIGVGALAA